MEPAVVESRDARGVVTLTMNQPEQRNPLTGNTAVAEFLDAIDRIDADNGVRCVVVTANGPSFSAGGDIRDMKRQASPEVSEMAIRQEYRRGIQKLTLALFNLEVPVIAAVNGHAIGAGLDLACMCDIRIASEKAKFAESFVKLGIIPGDGGAWLLPRVTGGRRWGPVAVWALYALASYRWVQYLVVSRYESAQQWQAYQEALLPQIMVGPLSAAVRAAWAWLSS